METLQNISSTVDVNHYDQEKTCVYENEKYSVRDNGAVLRHAKQDGKKRKIDNIWTFGEVKKTGYLEIASARVHRIVATAFHGDPPTSQHIVDHIDTNRQNNRPENLRWVTKLENILLNPITSKKIELLCGCSIEEVLKNISILQAHVLPPNIAWMKTVTQCEADKSLEHWLMWEKRPKNSKANGNWLWLDGEWLVKSKTKGAAQRFHKALPAQLEFPCCPQTKSDDPLGSYFNNSKVGEVFYIDEWYEHKILDAAVSPDRKELWVKCRNNDQTDACDIFRVTYENGFYIHFHDTFYPYYTMKDREIEYYWPWESKTTTCGGHL